MKKILVTGSSGYIGQHLIQLLKEKYDVEGLDYQKRYNVKVLHCVDINQLSDLTTEYNTVIHLAALVNVGDSVQRPAEYYTTNVFGTMNVLSKIKFKNFVFASTGAAAQPGSPYGVSKRAAEDVVANYCQTHDKTYTIFRFYNVIGSAGFRPTNPDGLFYNLIKAVDTGTFNMYGQDYNTRDGTCVRDYVHVMEICAALETAIETPANQLENLGHGQGHTVQEIVDIFKQVNRVKFQVVGHPRRPGDLESSVLDSVSPYMKNLYKIDQLLKAPKTAPIKDLTLLIKSFKRKSSVDNLIKSIRSRYHTVPIVVVDDSGEGYSFDYDDNITTYNIAFDSGVSAGRNYGLTKIKTEQFVTLDDDFEFTDQTDLARLQQIFKKSKLDILGGVVNDPAGPIPYYGMFSFNEKNRTLVCHYGYQVHSEFNTCEIIPQFFIAKTKTIQQHGWDPDLKTAEHSAFFFSIRNKLSVGFTDQVSIDHCRVESKTDYLEYRRRGDIFLQHWFEKIGIDYFETINRQIFIKSGVRCINISSVPPNLRRKAIFNDQNHLMMPRYANDWTSSHAYGIAVERQSVIRSGQVLELLKNNPHPAMARVYDYDDDFVYMEYINGTILSNANRFAPAQWKQTQCYLDSHHSVDITPIEDAVEFLHSIGVAHTDITTFNIMVDHTGHCKLIDLLGAVPLTDELETLDNYLLKVFKKELIKNHKGKTIIRRK